MWREKHIPMQAGKRVESDLLGEVRDPAKTFNEAQHVFFEHYKLRLIESGKSREQQTIEMALEDVRHRQPGSPQSPEKPFARSVLYEVRKRIGVTSPKEAHFVGLYTAVGSYADFKFHTDGFFQIIPPTQWLIEQQEKGAELIQRRRMDPVIITLDVTLEDKSNEKDLADVIIWVAESLDGTEKEYYNVISEVAEKVIRALERKMIGEIPQEMADSHLVDMSERRIYE